MIWPDAFSTLLTFSDAANTHADQLTLAEFSAIRTRRLVQNLDMMAVARTVNLTEGDDKANAVEHEIANDGDAKRMQCEFMGGEPDLDEVEEIDEEALVPNAPCNAAKFTIEAARSILQRDRNRGREQARATSRR